MPNKVVCKMKCTNTSKAESGMRDVLVHDVRMVPVTSGSPENEKFFKYTPGGELKLSVLNTEYFEPGKEYYITIEEVQR